MTVATWIAFLVYAAIAIALGRAGRARESAPEEFWTAGRSLPWPAVGTSISAGFLSISWSCVYAVQLFYGYGLGALWLMTVPWLLALGGIYFLSSRYRALPAFSQPEMVGQRFGLPARRLVAAALAFVFLVWGGAEIYVAARLLSPALAVPVPTVILLIAIIVALYSTTGGFRAVIDTDRLQYAIVAVYILAMAWLAWRGLTTLPDAAGTLAGLWSAPPNAAATGQAWTRALAPGWALIGLTLVAYLPGWLFETDLWVRVQAARGPDDARRGVLFAMINAALFVGIVPLFIGVAALVLFPPVDGIAPAAIGVEGDAIFAALVSTYAPPAMAVLVAVGLVAAAMSTIDTCTHVMALSVAYDLLGYRTRAGASRTVNALAVAAAALFALGTESLWDIFYLSSGILTTAVAFPVAAVFWTGVRPRAVAWSSAAGFAGTAIAYFLGATGVLAAIEPTAVTDSGIAFILWGSAAAVAGAVLGQLTGAPAGLDP